MFSECEIKKLKPILNTYIDELCEQLPNDNDSLHTHISQKTEKKIKRELFHARMLYYPLINTVTKRAACFITAMVILSATALGTVILYTNYSELFLKASLKGFTEMLPSYIPKGFVLVKKTDTQTQTTCEYKNENGQFITFKQSFIDNEAIDENADKYIDICGYKARFYKNSDVSYIVISTDDYMFSISANISEELIVKIAESIF